VAAAQYVTPGDQRPECYLDLHPTVIAGRVERNHHLPLRRRDKATGDSFPAMYFHI
jgi:hypothetical protein